MMLVRHTMKKWLGWRPGIATLTSRWSISLAAASGFSILEGLSRWGQAIAFLFPGNVEHQASALEDCEVLDIFTPMRGGLRSKIDEPYCGGEQILAAQGEPRLNECGREACEKLPF